MTETIPASIPRSIPGAATGSSPCRCLHRGDLEAAQRVHEALIPSSLRDPRFDVAVLFRPRDWLGGDYCQAVLVRDRLLYATICDVTGHGIASAMLASRVSMIVRGMLDLGPSPRDIIERVDEFYQRFYARAAEDLPLSFIAGRLDLETRAFTYASAGHPGPLYLPRDTSTHLQLPTQHLLIGVLDSCILEPDDYTVRLAAGDRLALFSDGVIDDVRGGTLPLGCEGLANQLLGHPAADVFALSEALDGHDTNSSGPSLDDRTLLLLEVR